ncbi:MAG: CDP-alcohol phosphatidyltransferase family protein [Polyangiaceae bacterium]
MAELVYKVEDRSILLPYFRRYVVDPCLPFIPAKIHPNTITHVGHLVNLFGLVLLLGLRPEKGWPFFVTALCVNLYNWCDNADGSHARRTKQCSPFGEFLDHGLDQFNTVYIALLSAYAIGAPTLGWVAMAILIPGAAVVTYWEQSNTGVFRVGMLNQVESVVVITITLAITGITGQSLWGKEIAFGLHVRDVMVLWPCSTILFGMARNLVRVASQCGVRATGPILVYIAFAAAIFGSVVVGAVDVLWAVALASALNIHLGMRMLARRLKKEPPQVEPFVLGGAVAVGAIVVWKLLGRPLEPSVVPALVVLACAMLGFQVILDARTGVTLLGGRADQTA